MNAVLIRKGLGRIVGWCALVGVTVLLTLLFSILGNLTCAVVGGMILGSARRWQWSAILVSLVFPAVILALSYSSKVQLPAAKVYLVAILTVAAFWGVFGLTLSMRFMERKGETSAPSATGIAGEPGRAQGADAVATPELDLAALRGNWNCEEPDVDGTTQRKTLRIKDGKFSLSTSSSRRREHLVARGIVRINEAKPSQIEFTSEEPRRDVESP